MPSIHTPERLEGESFENYKLRRKVSKEVIDEVIKGIFRKNPHGPGKPKDTKHTRNYSSKRKGAL